MKIFRIVIIIGQVLGIISLIRDLYIYKTTGVINSINIHYYFLIAFLGYLSCILFTLVEMERNKGKELKDILIEKQKVYIKTLESLLETYRR